MYVVGAAAMIACGGPHRAVAQHASSSPVSTGPAPPAAAAPPAPAASPRAAVQSLLDAEMRLDHQRSYALLSAGGRAQYRDVADWTRRRTELPAVTQFRIEGDGAKPGSVVVLVQHRPSLDPFIGLSPARERQTWTGRREGGGWLLEPEPEVQAIWPSDSLAAPAALRWARAVQACDQTAARGVQAVDPPLGLEQVGQLALCGTPSSLGAGPTGSVAAGPASAALVAQYTTDALAWARAIPITGGPKPFSVVLAPVGDGWQVVGLAP